MADTHDPVADPAAIVPMGNARFTVLSSRLIRMEWSPDGAFEDRASQFVINRRLPVPRFDVQQPGEELCIRTDHLEVSYYPDDTPFSASNLIVKSRAGSPSFKWKPGVPDRGNLGGTARTLDETKGAIELEPGILSRDGWVVINDSTRIVFDSWPDGWITPRNNSKRIDWYFFGYGHDYKSALHDFTLIAGSIPLPPRYVLGPWWSRYWAYSDRELKEIVRQFRANEVPLDVLVVDMDWHFDGWTGYTWNPQLFPDPEGFLRWAHEAGIRTTLNLHPADGVKSHEAAFEEFARAIGDDPRQTDHIPFNCTDPGFIKPYFELLHHPLERQGVDFWWIDWQQGVDSGMPGLDPLWWLNHLHWRDMETKPDRADARPLIFSRWGGLGNHRYPVGFSGDTHSTWEALAFQPKFTATAANVGYGWWSHDIGGHYHGPVDGELYLRWIQFGALSPILRTHTSKHEDAERRIWEFPEHFELMREAFQLRTRLAPYLYTAARQAYDSGVSMCRPMYYDWPGCSEAYTYDGQYMLGDALLCAPVTKPVDPESGTARIRVWLPPGRWVRWHTQETFNGDQVIDLQIGLDEIPMFVRAGRGLVLGAGSASCAHANIDPLTCILVPDPSAMPGEFTHYEDDGLSGRYRSTEFFRWWIQFVELQDGIVIYLSPIACDGYAGMPSHRTIELHVWTSHVFQSVRIDGRTIARDDRSINEYWTSLDDGGVRIVLADADIQNQYAIDGQFTSERDPDS